MAIGLGLFFNIQLPINFSAPLLATNIIEFWRRWHITLSEFLKNYIYIPLGGNRKGPKKRYINLLITMILGGIWHGAGWTFLIWGTLHGIFLIINHTWQKLTNFNKTLTYKTISWLLTFLLVVIAFSIFKATNMQSAVIMLKGMSGFHATIPAMAQLESLFPNLTVGPDIGPTKTIIIWLPIALLILLSKEPAQKFKELYLNNSTNAKLAICFGILIVFTLLSLDKPSTFLYFQF